MIYYQQCAKILTNRTLFHFSEGERELVSGLNVEYGAGGFAMIQIAITFFSFAH